MIQRKNCKCSDGCPLMPTIGFKGMHYTHAPQEMRDEKTAKLKEQRNRSIRKQKEKQKVRSLASLQNNSDAKDQVELNNWFLYVASIIRANPRCWECNSFIPATIKRLKGDVWVEVDNYRNASAHIFPKAIFDSVKVHPLNFLVLGAGCGCHDKTHRLDTFSKMKVWQMAVGRFLKFQDSIEEKHKYLNTFIELTKL